jgi:hypothetical protein
MLIRQVRSFGSLSKELVSMLRSFGKEKPEGSFGAPTYFIGGSNFTLHGRVGLFDRLALMTLTPFGGIINRNHVTKKKYGNLY